MTTVMILLLVPTLVVVGRWGRRNAASLVPRSLSADGRRSKERSLRRGSTACLVFAGVLFLGFVLAAMHDRTLGVG